MGAGARPRGSASPAEGQRRAGATRGGRDGRSSSPARQVSRRRVARVALRGGAVVVHGAGGTEGCGQQLHGGRRPGGRWGRVAGRAGGSEPGRRRRVGSRTGSQRAPLEPELPPPPPLPSAPGGGRTSGRAPGGSGLPRQRGRREGRARRGRGRSAAGRGSPDWARPGPRGRRLQPGPPSRPARPSAPRPRPAPGVGQAGWVGAADLRLHLPPPPRRLAGPPPACTKNLEGTGHVTLCPTPSRTSARPTRRILFRPLTGTGPGTPASAAPDAASVECVLTEGASV